MEHGRDRDPNAVLAVTGHEVDLADFFAVHCIEHDFGFAGPRHAFQAVGSEVGNQNVAIAGEGETIGQGAIDEFGAFVICGFKSIGVVGLCDDRLAAIRGNPNHTTTRIGRPQGAVFFREDAFRALQVFADELEIVFGEGKPVNWIG